MLSWRTGLNCEDDHTIYFHHEPNLLIFYPKLHRKCCDLCGVFTAIVNMSLIKSVIPTCIKQTTIVYYRMASGTGVPSLGQKVFNSFYPQAIRLLNR